MFEIDFKRLMALLLPTFLRKPVLFGLLRAAVNPIESLYAQFVASRKEHLFRLTHNGQVCYLRAGLNETFGGGFKIYDAVSDGKWLYAITEDGSQITLAIDEGNDSSTENVPIVFNEDRLNAAQNDFLIFVPSRFTDNDLPSIKAFVDKYKLVTKRATYYFDSVS